MSFRDKAKAAAEKAKKQAGTLASQHSEKIDRAIDKGSALVDQKTHGKYKEKVDKGRAAAKGAADKLAAQEGTGPSSPTPGAPVDGVADSSPTSTQPSPTSGTTSPSGHPAGTDSDGTFPDRSPQ